MRKLRERVDAVIAERRAIKDRFHVGTGEKVASFFKDRGLDLVKLLAGALTVRDDVMTRFLRETELYADDQYIADQIRAPLEHALRRAWDAGSQPVVSSGNQSLVVIVDNTLRQRGLYTALQRSQPTPGGNGIRVEFEAAAFDDLVLWLGDLHRLHGLLVQSGSFSVATGDNPGRVNASVTLER